MRHSESVEFSVVIPTFNPGEPLIELIKRLAETLETGLTASYEIIIVDDGSNDASTPTFLNRAAEFEHVSVIRLTKNFGKPGAVVCGLTYSSGEWVVTIDDDLQQAPEDIVKLAAHRSHDVIVACHGKKHHSWAQRFTSSIKQRFDRSLLGYKFPLSPLKLIRRSIVLGMLENISDRPFIPALIHQVTVDVVAVDVPHHPSAYQKSRYSFRRRLRQFSNLLIGNSDRLLLYFGYIGLMIMTASFLLATSIIIRKLIGIETETGWSSVMVAILMIGGLQLGAMSIIGQYLIRILNVSSQKPAYYVRDILGQSISQNQSTSL